MPSGKAHSVPVDGPDQVRLSSPRRRMCLVLGMHRSGTSALTRALGLAGAALPRHPVAASRFNEAGYWEPASIVALHDEILASLGLAWDDLRPVPRTWFESPPARAYAERLAGLVAEEYGDEPLAVLKDPRLCRLVPLWREVLRIAGIEPVFILALRQPAEVAASLAARDGLSTARALVLWLDHVLTAEHDTRGSPRVAVHYDRLLDAPAATLTALAAALDLPPPRGLEADADGMPTGRYRHHHADADAHTELGAWVETLYGHVSGRMDIDAAGMAVFDRVGAEFERARHYYDAIFADGDAPAAAERRHLATQLVLHQQEQARLMALVTDLERQHDLDRREQARLMDNVVDLDQRRAAAEVALSDSEQKRACAETRCAEQIRDLEELSQMMELYRRRTVGFRLRALAHRLKAVIACPPRLRRAARRIRASGLFDEQWYCRVYADVGLAAADPVLHYVRYGVREGRKPNSWFDTHGYLSRHPDVAASGTNPFLHYILTQAAVAVPLPAPAPVPAGQAVPHHGALAEQVEALESKVAILGEQVAVERLRVDYALGAAEGLLAEIDAFHAARSTPEYQAAFDMERPLVTICVATCNRAQLLIERCLASLLAQTYDNLQIVVVGDHCTDDTAHLLAKLRDDRIVFHNLAERGPYPRPGIDRWRVAGSNAMNKAMELAQGQFVTHLDDDDRMTVDRIEVLLRAAQENRADLCWHPFWYEAKSGSWKTLGDGRFELGQITTGSIFYHRYLTRFGWDAHAYRLSEPGDWNRLRRIRLMRPNLHFVPNCLLYHYTEQNQAPFEAQPGERFLE